MRAELGKGPLIATLLAGSVLGAVVAGSLSGDDTQDPGAVVSELSEGETQSTAAKAGDEALLALVEALRQAHIGLADAAGQGDGPDEKALQQALLSEKSYARILQDFFKEAGPRSLVSGGELTAAGQAILDFATSVEDHGLDKSRYPVPEIEKLIAELPRDEQARPGPDPNSTKGRLATVLQRPSFDAHHARELLRELGEGVSVHTIAGVEEALLLSGQDEARDEREVKAEIRVARVLMTLVLDFQVFKRAGPFRPITNKSEPFALYGKRPDKTVETMVEVALAAKPMEALRDLEPPRPSYRQLVELHRRYRKYAAAKCQKQLYNEWRLKVGKTGAEVRELQKRLACEGFYDGPIHGSFDEGVKAAVVTYQRHHSLHHEGFVKKGTLNSMNVPLGRRADQIALVLQRMRETHTKGLGDTYIRVNIPSFQLEYTYKNEVIRRHDVIVGTNRLDDNKLKLVQGHLNRTRLFTTELYEIIVNPDWILPERVEKGEVLTKLSADPNYLKKNNIRRFTLPSGKSALVQGRGELNVLGKVKFLLRESNAIFLHDTNDRSLFRHPKRDLSHGCVRVQQAVGFARWLLERDGWEEREIRRTFKSEKTQRGMKLKKPIRLVTEYMTVDVSAEGLPVFYHDVYGYDDDYFKGQLPAVTEVRWGDPRLRPSWVPRVPKEIVDSWRRAGKAAPRDYTPPPAGG